MDRANKYKPNAHAAQGIQTTVHINAVSSEPPPPPHPCSFTNPTTNSYQPNSQLAPTVNKSHVAQYTAKSPLARHNPPIIN